MERKRGEKTRLPKREPKVYPFKLTGHCPASDSHSLLSHFLPLSHFLSLSLPKGSRKGLPFSLVRTIFCNLKMMGLFPKETKLELKVTFGQTKGTSFCRSQVFASELLIQCMDRRFYEKRAQLFPKSAPTIP